MSALSLPRHVAALEILHFRHRAGLRTGKCRDMPRRTSAQIKPVYR
jgi:hypothetical protein